MDTRNFIDYAEAKRQGEQYREKVIAALKVLGYEVTQVDSLFTYTGPDTPEEMTFRLFTAPYTGTYYGYGQSKQGAPIVEYAPPAYAEARRTTWKQEVKGGWTDQTAAKHAERIAADLSAALLRKKRDDEADDNRTASYKTTKQINERLGLTQSYRFQAQPSSAAGKVLVKVELQYVVSPDQAEAVLCGFQEILKHHNLPV